MILSKLEYYCGKETQKCLAKDLRMMFIQFITTIKKLKMVDGKLSKGEYIRISKCRDEF